MSKKTGFLVLITVLLAVLFWLSERSMAAPRQYWRFPLDPPAPVLRGFEPPAHNWLPGHRGVDLKASSGQPVFAPADGQVRFVDQIAGRGVVVIAHGGLRTTYEPVVTRLTVGEIVSRGDQIGVLGCGGGHCCIGGQLRCLHWGLLRGHTYLNPLSRVKVDIHLLPLGVLSEPPVRREDGPVQTPSVSDPSKRAYTTELLPNWRGQGSLALL